MNDLAGESLCALAMTKSLRACIVGKTSGVEKMNSARQDRPIASDLQDRLDRGPFVDRLISALVQEDLDERGSYVGRRATGYVIGLSGRWGSGKSSILNLLHLKLDRMDDVVVVSFNPWLFRGRDELVVGFFNSLRSALGNSRSEKARSVVNWIDRYWGAIKFAGHGVAAAVDMAGGGGVATAAFSKWEPNIRTAIVAAPPRSPDEERAILEQKIDDAKFAVVVLIDELDRVEDEEVRAVAQLIKAIGEIKGLSYLVTFDPDRVIQALGRGDGEIRRMTGERYLEKIIQHTIPLRPLFIEDINKLFFDVLSEHKIELPNKDDKENSEIINVITRAIETPRDIKRLIGSYSVIWRMVMNEVHPYDVLAYCWIMTKSYELREKISENLEELVLDPGLDKMTELTVRRMNKIVRKLDDILGSQAVIHEKLLRLMFPGLFQLSSTDAGGRIAKRRNLVRLLYLGNPPGAPSRQEIDNIWNEKNISKIERDIRQKVKQGRLAHFLDRVDDLIAQMPKTGDQTFWVGVSKALTRTSDWLVEPEVERGFSEDVASTVFRIGQRDLTQASRLMEIVNGLIHAGDLCIVPWIVKKHIFALGLTDPPQGARGGEVLRGDEANLLIDSELERYRNAVMDGTILRRATLPDAFICLALTKKMDGEAREKFTMDLNNTDALWTFAGLLVPPGHLVDKEFISRICDIDVIRQQLDTLYVSSVVPGNPWLAQSVQRLRQILWDRDPDAL